MANIKKSFNFRNGVQVDEDNLLVTPTGLVGIGTTVPSEALDIVGNVIVSGVTSTTLAQAGILTVTTLNYTEIIGSGISISSGVVTSTGGGGIVTFFGDGQYLQNLPTTEFVSSSTGIALTSQNCGIGTTNAISTLQVGGDPNTQPEGVGISSYGHIKVTGIVTATSFVGPLTGAVTGNVIGNLTGNISGNAPTATLADDAVKLQTARNIAGVPFDGSADISLPGVNSSGSQNTSGTAANLSGSPNITVSGIDLNGNLDVSGTTILGNTIEGVSGENKIPSLYANLNALPNPGTYHGLFAHVHATGKGYFSHAGGWYELVNVENNGTVGTSTETYSIGSLSVGTNSPANDVHIRKTGDTELQITSDTGTAGITVGRESGVNNTNNAEIRYGGGSGFTYSSDQSLDIINYGTGNFNYHLSANNPSGAEGDFFWHKGSNNVRLMTLTNTGRLGIGVTEPTDELDIVGGATVSGNVVVGNNLTVSGNISGNVQGSFTGNFAGTLDGNTNTTVGISTLNNLSIAGIATASRLRASNFAIGQNPGINLVDIFVSSTNKIIINDVGQIGISTTTFLSGITISASTANATFAQIGCGILEFTSGSVDFSGAGGTLTARRYMIPPKVSNTVRNSFTGLVSGAMIYNTSINKLQVYNGSSWETVTSS